MMSKHGADVVGKRSVVAAGNAHTCLHVPGQCPMFKDPDMPRQHRQIAASSMLLQEVERVRVRF